MTTVSKTRAPTAPGGQVTSPVPSSLPGGSSLFAGWPLVLACGFLPVWWVLGLTQLIFFAVSVPMAILLFRRGGLLAPKGFGVWLLFLVWVLGGILVLQVDAPGAVPGNNPGRYLTFLYRFGWYVVGTIALLYVANSRHSVPVRRVGVALSAMFLTLVAGGYLGLLLPSLEFPSLVELALPHGIASTPFVQDLVHAQTAQIQDFLGYEEARPSAPFTYTNEWGLVIALTLPFFVATCWDRGRRWRMAMVATMVVAAVPLISSLNRGLWGALIVMALFVAVRAGIQGRRRALMVIAGLGSLAIIIVAVSPLGNQIAERLANPHSNEGRSNLGLLSVESALEGSPLIGFGSTRDVLGNFTSIAGGATASCPHCSPPPLGTQGQLWLLVFGAGVVGLVLYVAFLFGQFVRHVHATSAYSVASLCAILVLFVTMPVYNAVGVGIFVALVAIGVLSREAPEAGLPSLSSTLRPLRRSIGWVVLLTIFGGLVGAGVHVARGTPVKATQAVLVPPSAVTGVLDARPLTLDSEALLFRATPVLDAIEAVPGADAALRDGLTITAQPNSRILRVSFTDTDEERAVAATRATVDAYLAYRRALITESGSVLEDRLTTRQQALDSIYVDAADALGARDETPGLETLTSLRAQSRATLQGLETMRDELDQPGRAISDVNVRRTRDSLVVWSSSGAVAGGGLALLIVPHVDRRRRLGAKPAGRLDRNLPIVAQVRREDLDSRESLIRVHRATAAYAPLAGVLADERSVAALGLARLLNAQLENASDHYGTRVLLVASSDSRTGHVEERYLRAIHLGLNPVGVVLVTV